jgi:Ca-activated chloride channel family protein
VATQLLSQGEDKLASAIFSEVEHLQTTHSISAEGRKRIKYGTRALLLPDGKKQDSNI